MEMTTQFKVLLLGASGVGKTSFLKRYVKSEFSYSEKNTLTPTIMKSDLINWKNEKIVITFVDTAGLERFKSLTPNFYRGTQGILIFYDVARKQSFESTNFWYDSCVENLGLAIPKLLVANKTDVGKNRKVTQEEGQAKAKEWNIQYYEVSVKNNSNVTEVVNALIPLMESDSEQSPEEKVELDSYQPKAGTSNKSTKKGCSKC